MHLLANQIRNEEGSVLVAALLFMVLLTLIGTSAMNTSSIEQQIAANDKFHKIAFQNADSGIYTTPKIISACIDAGNENITPTPPGVLLRDPGDPSGWGLMAVTDGTFYREMMGYNPYEPATDMRMVLAGNPVEVDIRRVRTETLEGGGAEFGAGAEGLGSGSTGSSAIVFEEDSFGEGPSDSASNIGAFYRKILDMPGGL